MSQQTIRQCLHHPTKELERENNFEFPAYLKEVSIEVKCWKIQPLVRNKDARDTVYTRWNANDGNDTASR